MTASLPPDLAEDDVAFAGVLGQRALLEQGRLSSEQLVALALRRAEAVGARLGAFRTLFPEQALEEARACDARRAAGGTAPLLGLPFAVKDNHAVAGHAPSYGTGSPEPVAPRDSELVRRLRAAGAVVVGTTHLPELALWGFTESQTWGPTRNAFDPSRTPGGSSGGSATAVAAGVVPFATASDGGGSIRIPASFSGLVGLKATEGRVPLSPDAEHWHGLSSAGVLARSTADAAVLYEVLLQEPLPLDPPPRLRVARSLRPASPVAVDDEVRDAVDRVAGLLRDAGHEVVDADPSYAGVQESWLVRYARGARDDLVRLVDPSRTELRTRVVAGVGARLPERAVERARRLGRELAAVPLPGDVVLTPTTPFPAHPVGAHTGLRTLARAGRTAAFTQPWNATGQPALSLPVGLSRSGLPLAVQLVAARGEDLLLLRLAAQLESALEAVLGPLPRPDGREPAAQHPARRT